MTMSFKSRLVVFGGIIFVIWSSFFAVSAEEDIKISSMKVNQGEYFKIFVNESVDSVVQVKFLDDVKLLQPVNNKQVGLIAVSYYTSPGQYPLIVMITQGDQTINKEFQIEVTKRVFPEDRIVVAEKVQKEILTDENSNSDTKNVSAVRGKALNEKLPPMWEGVFIWPFKGKVTTDFGLIRYVNDQEEGRHSGFDIAAPMGTPVNACNRGKVVFAGRLYLTGLTVIIYHGLDLFTSYCHLSKIKVTEGELVNQSTIIGLVGATGLATGPHLHLTYRIGETSIDPNLLLGHEVDWNY